MGMQWYIIHTYSGFEKKVKESLEGRVAAFRLQDKIGRVMIPTEDVVEVRGGKKVVSSRMSYPGYVLVEMDMDDDTWHVVRSTPRVTGFVGSGQTPSPLTEEEVESIINRVTPRRTSRSRSWCSSATSRCASSMGRLRTSPAWWKRSMPTAARLKVSVTIFGRSTPVELDFAQCRESLS